MQVLVIEDEAQLARHVSRALARNGHEQGYRIQDASKRLVLLPTSCRQRHNKRSERFADRWYQAVLLRGSVG